MRNKFFTMLVFVCAPWAFAQQIRPPSMAEEPPAAVEQKLVETQPGTLIGEEKIPAGSRIYVAEMPNGFENYIIAGLQQKKVPVTVVSNRDKADFEISGIAESEAPNWAKMLFSGDTSKETASIKMIDLKSGSVVFAYSFHKSSTSRGKQSAAEACAKHIKEKIVAATETTKEAGL